MTTDNIDIRLADNNDYPQLIALFSEFADFEGRKEQMTNSVDKMNAESDFFNCLVAEKDGKIIGYVAFFYCYFTWSRHQIHNDAQRDSCTERMPHHAMAGGRLERTCSRHLQGNRSCD